MRALVTGGSGFIGSHVVDRLLAEGHEVRVFDVRAGAEPRRKHCEYVVGDLLDPERHQRRGARLRRHHPPRRRGRRRPRRQGSGGLGGAELARHAQRARGGPRDRRARRLRLDDLGLLRRPRDRGRRGLRARPALAPLHLDEARGRDVLPLLRRAVRRADDDPALRDPLRPARPSGRGAADLRQRALAGEPIDDRRRRPADAPLRLRRGPRRGRRARAARPRPPAASTTSSATRRSRPRHRRGRAAPSSATCRSSTPRAARRTSPARRVSGERPPPSSAGARRPRSPRASQRYVAWHSRSRARAALAAPARSSLAEYARRPRRGSPCVRRAAPSPRCCSARRTLTVGGSAASSRSSSTASS